MTKEAEAIEKYRISPTGNRATPLRSVVDYFFQKAPGIDCLNASKPFPENMADIVWGELQKSVKPKLQTIHICDRRKYKLSIDDLSTAVFPIPYIYCHKKKNETELDSVLRHMRNAIAHGRIYVKYLKRDTQICMTDTDHDGKASAKIVINLASLKRWKKILVDKSSLNI